MNHSKKGFAKLSRTHERSEIFSGQPPFDSDKTKGGEIAGFPWQAILALTMILLGILTVLLKGGGVF